VERTAGSHSLAAAAHRGDSLTQWAKEIAQDYADIALVLLVLPPAGPPEPADPAHVCLVMRDGEKVPWFAEGKGIDGLAYSSVPGRHLGAELLGDARFRRPGLRLALNFCDSRALMFTYHDGAERLAGEEIVDARYRVLYPDGELMPSLEEFFYLWGPQIEPRGPSAPA
jgi:hypothetical protein